MINEPQCDLCGSEKGEVVEVCRDPYRVIRCVDCGLVYVHPHPQAEKLNNAYGEGYYSEWADQQSHARSKMWKKRLDKVESVTKGKGELLDVGCGLGMFISLAAKHGWRVAANELSEYAAKAASKSAKAEVFHGQLENAKYSKDRFDVITIWHVLEHLESPLTTLRECARILKPGGKLIVAVPNVENKVFRFFYKLGRGKHFRLFDPDDKELHLYHFSSKTLKRILEHAGFKVVSITADPERVDRVKSMVDVIARVLSFISGRRLHAALLAICVKE